MTLMEVLLVIVMLAVLAAVFLPDFFPPRRLSSKINCINNVKQVCLAFRTWADDNNGKYPMEISVANGGTMELAVTGDVVATFQIMSNELSTPKVLICPVDTNYVLPSVFGTNFTAKNVSYFVGLDADANHSQALLSGDDNFAIGGVPVKSGLLELSTNAPITWTAARHVNQGNIGLADGSVGKLNSVLRVPTEGLQKVLNQTGVATNRLAIP